MLGLDQQDLTGDARAFMRRFGITYPNVRDAVGEVPVRWGATGIPETYFLDRRGLVVAHVIGRISQPQLADGIRAARTGVAGRALVGGARRPAR